MIIFIIGVTASRRLVNSDFKGEPFFGIDYCFIIYINRAVTLVPYSFI